MHELMKTGMKTENVSVCLPALGFCCCCWCCSIAFLLFFMLNHCLTIIIGIIIVIVWQLFVYFLHFHCEKRAIGEERDRHNSCSWTIMKMFKKQSCIGLRRTYRHICVCVRTLTPQMVQGLKHIQTYMCNKQIVSQCNHSTLTHTHFTNPF